MIGISTVIFAIDAEINLDHISFPINLKLGGAILPNKRGDYMFIKIKKLILNYRTKKAIKKEIKKFCGVIKWKI